MKVKLMADLLYLGLSYLFPLIILAIWSNADIKQGKIHNIVLVIPVIIAGAMQWYRFSTVFLPAFVGIFVLFSLTMLLKREIIGFADVIGIPFALMYLPIMQPFPMSVFTLLVAYLLIKQIKKKYDPLLKGIITNHIPLMPILFVSFFFSVMTYLIQSLVFG